MAYASQAGRARIAHFVEEEIFNNALELFLSALVANATDEEGLRVILRFDLNTIHLRVADTLGIVVKHGLR